MTYCVHSYIPEVGGMGCGRGGSVLRVTYHTRCRVAADALYICQNRYAKTVVQHDVRVGPRSLSKACSVVTASDLSTAENEPAQKMKLMTRRTRPAVGL